jgi:hypothetical protein
MDFKIEKEWTTVAGLKALILAHEIGHRAGYVAVNQDSVLFKKSSEFLNNFEIVEVDVHNGVIHADNYLFGREIEGGWYFGFDCRGLHDGYDFEIMSEYEQERLKARIFENEESIYKNFDKTRIFSNPKTLAFCEQECENLASQLVNFELKIKDDLLQTELDKLAEARKKAYLDDAQAQFDFATFLCRDWTVEGCSQAAMWFAKSAAQGNPNALCNLKYVVRFIEKKHKESVNKIEDEIKNRSID